MKQCPRCEVNQPEEEFHWKSREHDKRHSQCKSCVNAKNKIAWHDDDRHGKKKRQAERLKVNREITNSAKDVPCMDCGVKYPPYVMDFDHRDSTKKEFNVAQIRAGSPDRLHAEIAKCDVVCSNCHRIRTHNRLKEGIQLAVQRPSAQGRGCES